MYFLAENLPEVNPVAMNYKMRHNKNRPAKYSLAWPTTCPLFVVEEKQKNMVWTCEATCKGSYGGKLAQCVS